MNRGTTARPSRRPFLALLIAAAALLAGSEPAAANDVFCGAMVGSDVTLTEDEHCTGDGITVTAADVTIDLGGFALIGDLGMGDVGLDVNGHTGATIKNGTVKNFDQGIVSVPGPLQFPPAFLRLSNVRIASNVGDGADLTAFSVSIDKGAFIGNGGTGLTLSCPSGGKLTSSAFVGNSGDGLQASCSHLTIANVASTDNVGNGFLLTFSVGIAVRSSTFAGNHLRGVEIQDAESTKFTKNTVVGNLSDGNCSSTRRSPTMTGTSSRAI